MLSKSMISELNEADGSFVADTLRSVGKDMKSKDMDEEDVEEHVSCLCTLHRRS